MRIIVQNFIFHLTQQYLHVGWCFGRVLNSKVLDNSYSTKVLLRSSYNRNVNVPWILRKFWTCMPGNFYLPIIWAFILEVIFCLPNCCLSEIATTQQKSKLLVQYNVFYTEHLDELLEHVTCGFFFQNQ